VSAVGKHAPAVTGGHPPGEPEPVRVVAVTERSSLVVALTMMVPDWDVTAVADPATLADGHSPDAVIIEAATTTDGLATLSFLRDAGMAVPAVVIGDPTPSDESTDGEEPLGWPPDGGDCAILTRPFTIADLRDQVTEFVGPPPAPPEPAPEPGRRGLLRRVTGRHAAADPQPELVVPEPEPVYPEPEPEPVAVQSEPETVAVEPDLGPEPGHRRFLRRLTGSNAPADREPEPVDREPAPDVVAEPDDFEPEPEREPVAIEAEPEPEPEPVAIEPEPEPEPVAIETEPDPEPEPEPVAIEPGPEPVAIEAEPEPEPEPVTFSPEPDPEPEPVEVLDPSREAVADQPELDATTVDEDAVEELDEPATPSGLFDATVLLAEVINAFDADNAAVWVPGPTDSWVAAASYGLRTAEGRSRVRPDQPLFAAVSANLDGALLAPADLARGRLAGVPGSWADDVMAAGMGFEDYCVAVVVVGGAGLTGSDLRRLLTLVNGASPERSGIGNRLIGLLRR
jgi:hypothetical protein